MLDLCVQRIIGGSDQPADADFKLWLEAALEGRRKQSVLTLRIVDEAESRELNHQFRGKNQSANVLSFPAATDFPAGLPAEQLSQLENELGDLVICAPVVRSEAESQAKPLSDHWAHLLIHGCLHLLGFDHINETQAECMEALEIEILAGLGINNPYL